jgi:fido (protein-threonine AMPylation protein)/predicted kinase
LRAVSESKYEYPGTEVLINIPGIRDAEQLKRYEAIVTKERLSQLALQPVKEAFDLEHLKQIHQFIFKDVYPFAGMLREENIAKDFFTFAPTQHMESSAKDLFSQLRKEDNLKGLPIDRFADRAAHYMAEINVLHPFREGNGRTQREYIRQLAKNAGYDLDWSKLDPEQVLRASIRSTVNPQRLAELIREGIQPIGQQLQPQTTKDVFFRNGDYTATRTQVHENIVRQTLDALQPATEQPLVVFLGGGSASGKTSISQMMIQSFKDSNEHVLLIDSDKIKTMLPEYEQLVKRDPENMARQLHDESSDIATQMYKEALDRNLNIILDGTMKNAEKYERFIQAARSHDYSVSAVIADVPLEEAYRRADIRFEIEHRRVPREVIQESHRNVPLTFKRIEDQLDSFYLYDTVGRHPQQFYVKDNNQVLVKNDERLSQFFAKSEAQPELLKDLLKRIDGMPSIWNKVELDPKRLNREVVSHAVEQKGDGQLLKVKLKGDAKETQIQMDPALHLSKELKNQMIDQAAKGINGPGLSRGMDLPR